METDGITRETRSLKKGLLTGMVQTPQPAIPGLARPAPCHRCGATSSPQDPHGSMMPQPPVPSASRPALVFRLGRFERAVPSASCAAPVLFTREASLAGGACSHPSPSFSLSFSTPGSHIPVRWAVLQLLLPQFIVKNDNNVYPEPIQNSTVRKGAGPTSAVRVPSGPPSPPYLPAYLKCLSHHCVGREGRAQVKLAAAIG